MKEPRPRLVTAWLELPADGTLKAIKVCIKSSDGLDLTHQSVLDAVSDALIDDLCFSLADYDEVGPNYDA